MRVGRTGYVDNGDGTLTTTPPPSTGPVVATYDFDRMGRLIRQTDVGGAQPIYERQVGYNAKGQIDTETVISQQRTAAEGATTQTLRSVTTNSYGTGANYALGAVVSASAVHTKLSGSSWVSDGTSTTTNGYVWYDGALQASTTVARGGQTSTSSYVRDGAGVLERVVVTDGRPRTITFTNDVDGVVVARREADNDGDHGDPAEIRYRFAGREMGYVGNNDTTDKSYTETTAMRTRAFGTTWYGSGAFRSGQLSGVATGEFAQGFEAITSFGQGGQGGGYTVRSGDTLAGIAGQQWGDAALWYKLAQANGLSGDAVLVEGQQLIIPHGVMRSTHNAATFKPYDPAEALDDVNPGLLPGRSAAKATPGQGPSGRASPQDGRALRGWGRDSRRGSAGRR